MENYNLSQFRGILKKVTQNVFNSIITEEDIESLSGFALFSDGDASSISASYNTVAHYEKKCLKDPDEEREYYRWYPAEWKEEGIDSKELDALSKMLFEVGTSDRFKDKTEFKNYRNEVFASIVNVLKELKEEGFFSNTSKNFILVFSVSDYQNKEDEIGWIKTLNSEENFVEFEKWTNKG